MGDNARCWRRSGIRPRTDRGGGPWPALAAALVLLSGTPAAGATREEAGGVQRQASELYRAARYEEALPLFEKVLEEAEAAYGKHRQRLALALNNVGEVNRLLGRHREAEARLQRAVELAGTGGRGLGSSLNNLALVYREQGRLAEAVAVQERAVAVFKGAFGSDHPNVARGLNNLAALHRLRGEPEMARRHQEQAVAVAERTLGRDDPTTLEFRRKLARVAVARTEVARAGAARPPAAGAPPRPVAKPAAPPPAVVVLAAATAAPARVPDPPVAPPRRGPAPGPSPAARASSSGNYAVLVSSMRDAGGIPEEWQMLRRQFPELAGLSLRAPRPEATAAGVVYRLVAGAFRAEAQARAVCEGLRSGGQGCRVVTL